MIISTLVPVESISSISLLFIRSYLHSGAWQKAASGDGRETAARTDAGAGGQGSSEESPSIDVRPDTGMDMTAREV